MPWVGFAVEVPEDAGKEALESLGLTVIRAVGVVEVRTRRGWVKLRLYDVEGEVEGVAASLASALKAPALESGPHLILGEVSARLWDEGAKVVFPDGSSEVVALYTYDGFLDVRMPTDYVKGLKATIRVGGKTYELPLKLEDLIEIQGRGPDALEKLEKAVAVYGLEKIISREALEELKRRKAEVKVEVDYEAGFVLVKEGGKVRVAALRDYFLELLYRGEHERAKKVYDEAPEEVKRSLLETVREEYNALKELGEESRARVILEAAEKLGLQL
jgi:tetratricopeptide (TPR) repeat protein